VILKSLAISIANVQRIIGYQILEKIDGWIEDLLASPFLYYTYLFF
jgi:hypothetical protein